MIPESRMLRAFRVGVRRAAAWPFRVAAARATLRALANMDRRELADIGLNLSDVRDASALPLDRDPTGLLAERARERQRNSGAARVSRGDDGRRPARKPGRPVPARLPSERRPPLDRRARRFYRKRRFSRESWLILAQPMSRKSRSISVRRKRSARSTPVSPAAASGKR